MTTSVPAPSPLPAGSHQPSGETAVAPGDSHDGRPATAVVLSIGRRGALIEVGARRWLMSGAPSLPQGAALDLELTATGRQAQPARLVAIAGRALEPPITVRLQPVAPRPAGQRPAESASPAAPGIQVEARLIGPEGRPAGRPVALWLSASLSTGAAPSAGATAGDPATGSGVISGRDASGRLLLQTAGLSLRLETPLELPVGARLQLVLPQALALPPAVAPPAMTASADPWRRAIAALLQRERALGGESDGGALRLLAADHALAARLLRWIQTLSGTGKAAEAGPAGAPEPVVAWRGALGPLGRHTGEPQAGGWRVLLMPLGAEEPGPLKIYLRDVPEDPERDRQAGRRRRSAAQRAVFAIELSQLGRCQLDVLCRARRFDLVVRTQEPLEAALQDDICALVEAANEVTGSAGKVAFRAAELLALPEPRLAPDPPLTA